ncbi:MAG: hypothetical protein S4CHLAM123_13980 [Chlamydiales bacterium]|nr:hypothetical protein [Chlamydiales bacterium]
MSSVSVMRPLGWVVSQPASKHGRHHQQSALGDRLRENIMQVFTRNFSEGKSPEELQGMMLSALSEAAAQSDGIASKQVGVFFRVLKKCEDNRRSYGYISSLDYVVETLGPKLKAISDFSVEEIRRQFSAYGLKYVRQFFEPVEVPRDGDLAVYPGRDLRYGIFRESESSGNSPQGGIVESKWEWWSSPYVFQHDVFAVPPLFGDQVDFYRLKKRKVETEVEKLEIKPHSDSCLSPLSSNEIFTVHENGSLSRNRLDDFTPKLIQDRRIKIDGLHGATLAKEVSGIQYLPHIGFTGRCHGYAFSRILSTFKTPTKIPTPEIFGEEILAKYFTVTTAPQKGDLVVYYAHRSIKHWGVYLGSGRVESKWGAGSVYRHDFFDTPTEYGAVIKCYRLKDGLTKDKLLAGLQSDYERL